MSPIPSRASAPGISRITRESTWLETAKAMRLGTLALIMPVITSTLGRWVATTTSEEHTSELQSRQYLVCRLLLEKKNTSKYTVAKHILNGNMNRSLTQ